MQTIVSYFFLPSPLPSLSLHGAIYYGPIRVCEQQHGHVFLSSNRWHSPGVGPGWKTMLTEMKNPQKFCNCQAWYFTYVHACIYSVNGRTRVSAYFTTDSREYSGTRISICCKLATLSRIQRVPSEIARIAGCRDSLRIHSTGTTIFY